MTTLSPVKSRALALLLLALAVLVIFTLIVKPLATQYLAARDTIEDLENRLEVYQRVSATLPENRKRLEALQQNNPSASLYLNESRPSLAAAQLQQRVSQLIGDSGAQLVSTQILQTEDQGVLPTVAIQVHMRGEIQQIVDLFYQIESGKPLMFADNIVLSAVTRAPPRAVRRGVRNTVQSTSSPGLDLRFDLIGYSSREGM